MNADDQQKKGPMDGWMKVATDWWLSMASAWPDPSSTGQDAATDSTARDDFKTRFEEAWQKPLKALQTFLSSLGDAEGFKEFVSGSGAVPDVTMRLLRTGLDGYTQIYQQWMEKIGKAGESGEPYRFENLDEDYFRAWVDIYKKEIQPILNIPQLGLNRFYQERIYQTIDKYSLHQAALADFLRMVFTPLDKSIRVMEKEIDRLGSEGKLSENFEDYYQMWIKVLEGHYMTLFKSPDYLDSLAQTLSTLGDYKMARQKMLTDFFQSFPIPTNREMDELYKEIYLLKKKVNALSSRMESPEL